MRVLIKILSSQIRGRLIWQLELGDILSNSAVVFPVGAIDEYFFVAISLLIHPATILIPHPDLVLDLISVRASILQVKAGIQAVI